jgi:hypothetical protein
MTPQVTRFIIKARLVRGRRGGFILQAGLEGLQGEHGAIVPQQDGRPFRIVPKMLTKRRLTVA